MNNEDMSDVMEKLNSFLGQNGNNISPDMINNFAKMFNNSSSNDSNTSSNNYNNSGIDFETIMKMKTIIDKMNIKDDPRSNLLNSLKPYLNASRKSKVDQYIQLMNMSKVMDVFPFAGGDKKK